MDSPIRSLVLGFLFGLLFGVALMQFVIPPFTGTSVPSHGLTTATGCAEADDPRAWVGHVPDVEYRSVYLMNYTFTHEEPDIEIRAELTQPDPDSWVLEIRSTPETADRAIPEGCQPRTTLDASVALPDSAKSLRFTLDEESIAVVDTTSLSPRFEYLDD